MPYIYKPPKAKSKKKNRTEKQILRTKLYNKAAWKKLRLAYLMMHPLCQRCLAEKTDDDDKIGIVNPATDVHHINSPFDDGLSDMERLGRLLDPNNLESICSHHHGLLHRQQQLEK